MELLTGKSKEDFTQWLNERPDLLKKYYKENVCGNMAQIDIIRDWLSSVGLKVKTRLMLGKPSIHTVEIKSTKYLGAKGSEVYEDPSFTCYCKSYPVGIRRADELYNSVIQ